MKRYQIVIIRLACRRLNGFGGMVYGEPLQPQKILGASKESDNLSIVTNNKKKRKLGLLLVASVLIGVQGPSHAIALSEADALKLFAHSRLPNWDQFKCFHKLITKENSQWSVTARNHSHYGLGQMRSEWYRDLDGYRQIDETIKYIRIRYGSMCKAWSFHIKENYY